MPISTWTTRHAAKVPNEARGQRLRSVNSDASRLRPSRANPVVCRYVPLRHSTSSGNASWLDVEKGTPAVVSTAAASASAATDVTSSAGWIRARGDAPAPASCSTSGRHEPHNVDAPVRSTSDSTVTTRCAQAAAIAPRVTCRQLQTTAWGGQSVTGRSCVVRHSVPVRSNRASCHGQMRIRRAVASWMRLNSRQPPTPRAPTRRPRSIRSRR
jgi:hypothetical protein